MIDLGHTATVFKAGHRVRLDISSSNFPNLIRNLNTGGDFDDESNIVVAKQTIMHDPGHPSFLELDVAPGVTASGVTVRSLDHKIGDR
jgi:predicted acyl esterase